MTRLDLMISELIQIVHRTVIDHMPCKDNHEVVSGRGKSLESSIELRKIHAADR